MFLKAAAMSGGLAIRAVQDRQPAQIRQSFKADVSG